MFKWANGKYGNHSIRAIWLGSSLVAEIYGQVVLQMAILETLLSIEQHLTSIEQHLTSDDGSEPHADERSMPKREPT